LKVGVNYIGVEVDPDNKIEEYPPSICFPLFGIGGECNNYASIDILYSPEFSVPDSVSGTSKVGEEVETSMSVQGPFKVILGWSTGEDDDLDITLVSPTGKVYYGTQIADAPIEEITISDVSAGDIGSWTVKVYKKPGGVEYEGFTVTAESVLKQGEDAADNVGVVLSQNSQGWRTNESAT
jgi:hypothetical protein